MISVVQRKTGNDSTGLIGSVVVAFNSNNTAGNTIIAVGFVESNTLSNISTPTDTLGNTYIDVLDGTSGTHFLGLKVWVAYNIASGANTVTMADGNQLANLHIYEVSGLATSSAFDMSSIQLQFNQNSLSSGSTTTTTDANELLLGIFVLGLGTFPTWTAGSGYSNLITTSTAFLESATEERIVSSTGAYSATATVINNNAYSLAAIVTFGDTPIREDLVSAISDSTSIQESINTSVTSFINLSDVTVTSESVNLNIVSLFSTSDSTSTSESVALTNEYNVTVSDSTATSENVGLSGDVFVATSDFTELGELIDLFLPSASVLGIVIDENINTSENVVVLVPTLLIAVSDSTVTSENTNTEVGNFIIIIMSDITLTSESVVASAPPLITRTTSLSMTVPSSISLTLIKLSS